MAHRIQLSIAVVGLLLVGACGLDVVGIDPIAGPDASVSGGEGGVSVVDAGNEASPPPPPADCSKTTCDALGLAAPSFTQVAFGDAADACPSGFDATDVIEGPSVKNGSCGCGACVTQGTSCNTGKMRSSWSAGPGACDNAGAATDVVSGECHSNYNGKWISNYASEAAPAPTLGTCRAPGVGLRDQVAADAKRICTRRTETCPGAMCALPGKLQVCLSAAGDVDCPKGTKKHVVASDVTMTCADCTCDATAVCGGAITWWNNSSSSCTGNPTGTIAAGACVQVNESSIGSFRWDSKVASEGCSTPKPAMKATLAPKDVRTVCCP